jgi:hypothetical protein
MIASLLGIAAAIGGCGSNQPVSDSQQSASQGAWMEPTLPVKTELSATGRNPYFVLEPGYRLVLENAGKDSLTITVLADTKIVDGVETRVVEERETKHGQLAEISRNYFAISTATHALYYFGEDVDEYEDGKVVSHGGAWLAGVNGARAGMLLPGEPKVGQRFYQEMAPGVAMDRSEVISVSETIKTPAGAFEKCLKVADGSAVEKGDPEEKIFAPGVGLVKEEDFRLVKSERISRENATTEAGGDR